MYRMITFSYRASETITGSNGIKFKQGDTVSIRGVRPPNLAGWNSSLDGVYKVIDLTSRGLVVTGSATVGWGGGSINMPMNGIEARASGGAVISGAKSVTAADGVGNTADWWMHAFTSYQIDSIVSPPPPIVLPPVAPPNTISQPPRSVTSPPPPPQAPRPVIDPGPPPRDNGNDLDTGDGRFNIDQFIARANFKLGTSPAANNRGAARFIADATKAAKTARLTESQTKKLLDAVRKAIADARAKVKNKPLPKPKGRR
jgi:hypothetical protein